MFSKMCLTCSKTYLGIYVAYSTKKRTAFFAMKITRHANNFRTQGVAAVFHCFVVLLVVILSPFVQYFLRCQCALQFSKKPIWSYWWTSVKQQR